MIITLLIIAYSPMDTYSRRVTTFCRARGITTNTLYVTVAAVTMVLCSLALASETAVPPAMLKTLQLFTIPVSLASKVPQMLELYRDIYSGRLDNLQMFLLKEFFEILEKAIDRCREAGVVAYQIVLKNS